MNNHIQLVIDYLESWGNLALDLDYYLSLSDWEGYFSFLWNN